VVNADIKKHARINCIAHLLSQIDYKEVKKEEIVLPERQENVSYERPPIDTQKFVENYALKVLKDREQ